jgi:methionine sulfoxide reductase heme-binding subunit
MRLAVSRPAAARALVFLLCLGPFLKLVWDGMRDDLTANPIEDLTHRTGWWALTLLMVTLSVTPIRRITGWNRIVQYRRLVGLFAFFYASLHVCIYFGLDQLLSFDYILEDIAERPYITVGFTAWLLLIPLAVTSTRGWIRRLGKRWQRLHRLIYVSAALGVLHFLWLVKADVREPLIYATVLAVLLALRLPLFRRRQRSGPGAGGRSGSRASAARAAAGVDHPTTGTLQG